VQNVENVIISCAGLGSRLKMNMPKCLIKIGNKTIIEMQLELLKNVPNIRIVVGFKETEVIDFIKKIRNDVIFVRNPDYATTSNSYSIYLATKDLKAPYVIIDGDLIIKKDSFDNFLSKCKNKNLVGFTKAKTEDAVFVKIDENNTIQWFSRELKTEYEWCSIAYLYNIKISNNQDYVFKELEKKLPLEGIEMDCFEIDTPTDYMLAVKNISTLI